MYKIRPAAYIFTHSYLNTMQQGIQSLHVIAEFIANYKSFGDEWLDVIEWAKEHKVVRILNAGGGDAFTLNLDKAKKLAGKYKLPFSYFREEDFHNQISGFGFIVTPEIYFEIEETRSMLLSEIKTDVNLDQVIRENTKLNTQLDSHPLVEFLKSFQSAK